MGMRSQDMSNGYDANSADFIAVRSNAGEALIQSWALTLPKGGHVIDIGAGSGKPLTQVLIKVGLNVCALDASPNMVAAFKHNFPDIKITCEVAENSRFFDQTYDGILAVGLVFLLAEPVQRKLISHMAAALKPHGRLLFSAPTEVGTWDDVLTGVPSLSLGEAAYKQIIADNGLHMIGQYRDEGGSHYYEAQRAI